MDWDNLDDNQKQQVDEDRLLSDLAAELEDGDPDEALDRAEELGYDVDDLPL